MAPGNLDYSSKATSCITHIKRSFIFMVVLMFTVIFVMYGTTDNFRSVTFKYVGQSTVFNISRTTFPRLATLVQDLRSNRQLVAPINDTDTIYSNNDTTRTSDNIDNTIRDLIKETMLYTIKDTIRDSFNNTIRDTVKETVKEFPLMRTNRQLLAPINDTDTIHSNNDTTRTSDTITNTIRDLIKDTMLYTIKDTIRDSFKNTIRDTVKETVKEFPLMPDPCSKPRRNTGVEDVLCMKPPVFLPEYKNPCWIDGSALRCLPFFHLIGICKSGTSDFFKRLLRHPDIVPNKGIFGKEIWYWSWKRFGMKNLGGRFKMGMTLNEFTNQFHSEIIQNSVDKNGFHSKITGHGDPMDIWDRFLEEATPQNTPRTEELLWTTPYAVHHVNPHVKLLLMLRDPIDRLYSHYFHSRAGTSAESFHNHIVYSIPLWNACLKQHSIRSCVYNNDLKNTLKAPIYTSFYVVHLKEWLKVFPRKQILIFRNEDYAKDMKGTLLQVFSYLNVSMPDESSLTQMENLPHFYETESKTRAGPMKPETKKLLIELYRPYNEELAQLLIDERFAFRDGSFV